MITDCWRACELNANHIETFVGKDCFFEFLSCVYINVLCALNNLFDLRSGCSKKVCVCVRKE